GDFRAGILGEEDLLVHLQGHLFVIAHGDDAADLRLFLGSLWQKDAARGAIFLLQRLDQNAGAQRLDGGLVTICAHVNNSSNVLSSNFVVRRPYLRPSKWLILGRSKPTMTLPPISMTGTPCWPERRTMSRAAAGSRLTSMSLNLTPFWRK